MKEWPLLWIGVITAALCCLLTPIALALLGVASLRAVAGDLFLPLLAGVAALATLALGLRALARRQRNANARTHEKA